MLDESYLGLSVREAIAIVNAENPPSDTSKITISDTSNEILSNIDEFDAGWRLIIQFLLIK